MTHHDTGINFEGNIWKTHLPPISIDGDEDDELVQALNTLAQALQLLDISDASFYSYSTAISNLSDENATLARRLHRIQQVEEELKLHIAAIKHEHQLIIKWNKSLTPGPSNELGLESASTLERRKEIMVKKAKECHKELETLIAKEPLEIHVTISQLMDQKAKNQARERELKEKRAKIKAFQGLPPNLELARHELRMARQQQLELIKLRERLLGRMADGVV